MGIEEDIEFGWICQIIQKATHQRTCIEGILKTLWGLGLITLIGLLIAIIIVDDRALFVGAFAILIAAFTASFSMMRSIMHSALMEKEKRLEEMKKHKNFVLQLLFNLQNLLQKLNSEFHAHCGRKVLSHKTEDINQLLKRYNKTLTYIEAENTLIHLNSEEIRTVFDVVERSEKWLKTVAIFLKDPTSYQSLDNDIKGYTAYYLDLDNYLLEVKNIFAKDLD